MADPSVFIPVVGDEQLRSLRRELYNQHKGSVDANFSVRQPNGSIGAVSATDAETTLALGAAQQGALAWMQSGGDRNAYNQIRSDYMNKMAGLKVVASGTLNPAARAVLDAQTRNFDRGAATAQGLGLNSASLANFNTANRAIATKASQNNFFNSSNQQFTPTGGTLQAVGYSEAQQNRTRNQPTVRPR
jgi:hypothetical protein